VSRPPLVKGDHIEARPCAVTISHVSDHAAYGQCSTCATEHIIDRALYEADAGPWRMPPPTASTRGLPRKTLG
jgi:hypothetical protein